MLVPVFVFVYLTIGGITSGLVAKQIDDNWYDHPGIFASCAFWPLVLPLAAGQALRKALEAREQAKQLPEARVVQR